MNSILEALKHLVTNFKPFFIVQPWEQAVRVRFGRWVKVFQGDIHLKIPFADTVFTQSIRFRVTEDRKQTVNTACGHTVTVTSCIGFRIADIFQLYNTLHHAEDALQAEQLSWLAKYINSRHLADCSLEDICSRATTELKLGDFGIADVKLYIREFAISKAYRLIGDGTSSYRSGESLATN